jgi:hypothetical protein
MFVSHLPASLAACATVASDDPHLLRTLGLSLTQAFFVLKLLDSPLLRLSQDRRALLAFGLAIVLLHGGVIERSLQADADVPLSWQIVETTIGMSLVPALLILGFFVLCHVRFRAARSSLRAAFHRVLALAAVLRLPPRDLLFARALSVHRAPPR